MGLKNLLRKLMGSAKPIEPIPARSLHGIVKMGSTSCVEPAKFWDLFVCLFVCVGRDLAQLCQARIYIL